MLCTKLCGLLKNLLRTRKSLKLQLRRKINEVLPVELGTHEGSVTGTYTRNLVLSWGPLDKYIQTPHVIHWLFSVRRHPLGPDCGLFVAKKTSFNGDQLRKKEWPHKLSCFA